MIACTTLILAGGKSRRMGRDKALMMYRGKPMIEYALDLARLLGGPVILSANGPSLDSLGFPVVRDILHVQAPLAGIHAGLTASNTDWNLVLTCDMPHLPVSLVRQLADQVDHAVRLVLPKNGDFVEPLCGFWHRDLLPVIESQVDNGNMKLLDILPLAAHRILALDEVPAEQRREWFRNMNGPGDLTG